jgi:hypothetical protein
MKLAFATTLTIFIAATGGAVHAQTQENEGVVTVTRSSIALYPLPGDPGVTPVQRTSCTQLEIGARIPADECGRHTLSFVASDYVSQTSD